MSLQDIIVWVLFAAAIVYVGYIFYNQFFSKKTACGNCCGCSSIDLKRIEREIKEKMEAKNRQKIQSH